MKMKMHIHKVALIGAAFVANSVVFANTQRWYPIESSPDYEVFVNLSSLQYRKNSEVYVETVSNFRVEQPVDHVRYRSMSVIRVLNCEKKQFHVLRIRIFSQPFNEGVFLGRLKTDSELRLVPQATLVEKLYDTFCDPPAPKKRGGTF